MKSVEVNVYRFYIETPKSRHTFSSIDILLQENKRE